MKNFSWSTSKNHEEEGLSRHQLLARDLADGLADPRNLSHYLRYANRYPEPLLRQFLSEARSMPAARVRRSRAALFEALLRKHVARLQEDSRR